MTATPAEERAVDAVSLLDAEQALFRADVTREDLVTLVRTVFDAGLNVDAVADALARRAAPYLWETEHRDILLGINPSEHAIDRIITQHQQGETGRHATYAQAVRETVLGENA